MCVQVWMYPKTLIGRGKTGGYLVGSLAAMAGKQYPDCDFVTGPLLAEAERMQTNPRRSSIFAWTPSVPSSGLERLSAIFPVGSREPMLNQIRCELESIRGLVIRHRRISQSPPISSVFFATQAARLYFVTHHLNLTHSSTQPLSKWLSSTTRLSFLQTMSHGIHVVTS